MSFVEDEKEGRVVLRRRRPRRTVFADLCEYLVVEAVGMIRQAMHCAVMRRVQT